MVAPADSQRPGDPVAFSACRVPESDVEMALNAYLFPDAGLGGYARRVILNLRFPFSQVVALMARKVQVFLQDDVDGGAATQTVSIAVDGTDYEIDLSDQNARKLRDALAPWVAAARPVGKPIRRGGVPASVVDLRAKPEPRTLSGSEIRRWATENGIPISNRGRIPSNVRTQFEAAHSSTISPN